MTGYRLLAIHAHPDDESSKGAATMAMYSAEGHEVTVLTCTGGERGSILNPAMERPGILDNIAEVRREEMRRAAEALGVTHRWLGFVDSGLPEGSPLPPLPGGCFALVDDNVAADAIISVIRGVRPHVILTYDENGGYPHPDHLKVHSASMIAWEKAGDAHYKPELGQAWTPLKLYYTHGFLPERFELLHKDLRDQGKESPFEEVIKRMRDYNVDVSRRVTTRVNAADYFGHREAALRAHATQVDPDGHFLANSVEAQRRLWPTEEFELAATRVEAPLPETDLFNGLDEEQRS